MLGHLSNNNSSYNVMRLDGYDINAESLWTFKLYTNVQLNCNRICNKLKDEIPKKNYFINHLECRSFLGKINGLHLSCSNIIST